MEAMNEESVTDKYGFNIERKHVNLYRNSCLLSQCIEYYRKRTWENLYQSILDEDDKRNTLISKQREEIFTEALNGGVNRLTCRLTKSQSFDVVHNFIWKGLPSSKRPQLYMALSGLSFILCSKKQSVSNTFIF